MLTKSEKDFLIGLVEKYGIETSGKPKTEMETCPKCDHKFKPKKQKLTKIFCKPCRRGMRS